MPRKINSKEKLAFAKMVVNEKRKNDKDNKKFFRPSAIVEEVESYELVPRLRAYVDNIREFARSEDAKGLVHRKVYNALHEADQMEASISGIEFKTKIAFHKDLK